MCDHRFCKALVVGGGNGIGLAVTMKLSQKCDKEIENVFSVNAVALFVGRGVQVVNLSPQE